MNSPKFHNDIVNKFTDMNSNITNLFYNIAMNKLLINKENQDDSQIQINSDANNYFTQINQNITNMRDILKNDEFKIKEKQIDKNEILSSFKNLTYHQASNLNIVSCSYFPRSKIKYEKQSNLQIIMSKRSLDLTKVNKCEDFSIKSNYNFTLRNVLVIEQGEAFSYNKLHLSNRKDEKEMDVVIVITEEESKDQNYDMEEDKCENKIQPPSTSNRVIENHVNVKTSVINNKVTIKPLDINKIVNNRNVQIVSNINDDNNILSCENFKTQDLEEDFTNYINKPKKNAYKESFITKNLSPIKSQGEAKTEISKQISFTFQSPKNQSLSKSKKINSYDSNKGRATVEVGVVLKQKEISRRKKMVNFFDYHRNDLNVFEMSVS